MTNSSGVRRGGLRATLPTYVREALKREDAGDQEAFDMLRVMSQKTNIKLREVAERLVRERRSVGREKACPD